MYVVIFTEISAAKMILAVKGLSDLGAWLSVTSLFLMTGNRLFGGGDASPPYQGLCSGRCRLMADLLQSPLSGGCACTSVILRGQRIVSVAQEAGQELVPISTSGAVALWETDISVWRTRQDLQGLAGTGISKAQVGGGLLKLPDPSWWGPVWALEAFFLPLGAPFR